MKIYVKIIKLYNCNRKLFNKIKKLHNKINILFKIEKDRINKNTYILL